MAPAFLPAVRLPLLRARLPDATSPLRRPPAALASPPPQPPPPPAPPGSRPPTPRPASDLSHDEHSPLKPLIGRRALARALYRAATRPGGAQLVVLYCRARWCRTCSTLAPKVARIADERKAAAEAAGKAGMVWVSVDVVEEANRVVAREVGAEMLPTLVFLKPVDVTVEEFGRYMNMDGGIPGADEERQAVADRRVVEACFERKFIAGPFGHRRLEENLDDALANLS